MKGAYHVWKVSGNCSSVPAAPWCVLLRRVVDKAAGLHSVPVLFLRRRPRPGVDRHRVNTKRKKNKKIMDELGHRRSELGRRREAVLRTTKKSYLPPRLLGVLHFFFLNYNTEHLDFLYSLNCLFFLPGCRALVRIRLDLKKRSRSIKKSPRLLRSN